MKQISGIEVMSILNYKFLLLLSSIYQILSTYYISRTLLGFRHLAMTSTGGKCPPIRLFYPRVIVIVFPHSHGGSEDLVNHHSKRGVHFWKTTDALSLSLISATNKRSELNSFLT